MLSSYQLSDRINVSSVLFYGVVLPLYRAATAIDATCQAIRAALPGLLYALCLLAKALGLVAVVVGGAFLAFTFAVVIAKIVFGVAVIAAYAWTFKPRSKAVRK